MVAFRTASEMGADGIELDAKLTADNKIVVIHDATLDRTTNGVGAVRKLQYEDIRTLDAGQNHGERFAGETIPLLRDVLTEFHSKLLINIEVTNYSSPVDRLPVLIVKLLRELEIDTGILFSSFSPLNLIRLRSIYPEIPFALLLDPKTPGLIRFLLRNSLQFEYLAPHLSMVNSHLVGHLHKNGKGINVWTANEESNMLEMLKMGVDGLITDHPDRALNVIKRGNQSAGNLA